MVDISRTSYELVGLATNITGGHQPVTLHTPGFKLACRSPTRGVVDGEDPSHHPQTTPESWNCWLVVEPYPSEKYESVGMMTFPTEWKNLKMFQTTNQTKDNSRCSRMTPLEFEHWDWTQTVPCGNRMKSAPTPRLNWNRPADWGTWSTVIDQFSPIFFEG